MENRTRFSADFGKTAEDYARHRAGYPDWLFQRLMRRGLAHPGMRTGDDPAEPLPVPHCVFAVWGRKAS